MAAIAVEFLIFLSVILTLGYLIPAGLFHVIFFSNSIEGNDKRRIQQRKPTARSIRYEIRHSLVSVFLFAIFSTIVWQAVKAGWTAMYFVWSDYPWWTPIAGFVAAIVLHDAYFYWTHRLVHWPPLFPWMHAVHHKSLAPTPWAILSFQPLETIVQFGIFAIFVFFVPLHPLTLLAYLLYDGVVNAAGHCGHEFISKKQKEHWLLKYTMVVTHHDLHHSQFNCNFGQYFTIWDRMFGTFEDRPSEDDSNLVAQKPQLNLETKHS